MGKTLIWIDDNLAKELQLVNDTVELKEGEIKNIINKFKKEIEYMEETLDEDVISFRYHAQKVRDSYKKVVEEEIAKTYEIWEKMDSLRSETREKLDKTRELTKSVTEDVKDIQAALSKCNLYGVDKLLELVDKVNYMNDQDRELLSKLLEIKRQ